MSDLDKALTSLKEELLNEDCVKEYFYYKKLVDNDPEIKQLDLDMRTHQKLMCKNEDNDEIYFKEKEIYENLRKKLDNHPVLINYQIAKDEVFSLLVDIKNLLS